VAVLVSARTFSGGEELAFDLQQLGRATLVGERTRGGAHPRIGVRVHTHLEVTVPCARAVSPRTGTNWENGVTPDVSVRESEALETALVHLRQQID
jgi:C-terminal processing protease CtpA/Prc